MTYQKKTLKLYFTSGSSDKEYHVIVEADSSGTGYHVYGMNGKRGRATTRQSKTAVPVSLNTAETMYDALIEEKSKTGYTTSTSGIPFDGVQSWTASVTGTAPRPALSIKPVPWVQVKQSDDLDTLLENDNFGVQEAPVGIRLLLEVTALGVRQLDVITGGSWALPALVQLELTTVFEDCVLDGLYDTTSQHLSVVDGYLLGTGSSAKLGVAASFKARLDALVLKAKKASAAIVEVLPCYLGTDKLEIFCALQEHGRPRVLLHAMDGGYDDAADDQSSAVALVHYFK